MNAFQVGLGNYYGPVEVFSEGNNYFWRIGDVYGDEVQPIPEYLFAALKRFAEDHGQVEHGQVDDARP